MPLSASVEMTPLCRTLGLKAHYAGQSAASVEDVRPAATIVDELVRGAAAALGRVFVQH
jgi:hypothetical protein